jgi:hypothetical protein
VRESALVVEAAEKRAAAAAAAAQEAEEKVRNVVLSQCSAVLIQCHVCV